jgi:muconate cycloisomerase
MKVVQVEAIPLDARLSVPFLFGKIERIASSNVLLRLQAEDGTVAWGEACPVPQLTGETQEGVVALIEQRIAPLLEGADASRWRPLIAEVRTRLYGAPFAAAAVDMALLDLAGKALGLPVYALLGGPHRTHVEVHGSVGWDEQPERVADMAEAQAGSFHALKLYAGRDSLDGDLARIQAARRRVGDRHPFLLDVNGLWSPLQALAAAAPLRELGVKLVEQPVAPADRAGQAEVSAAYGMRHGIDIAADERIMSLSDVYEVAGDGLARCANVGLSKLGGIVAAFDAAATAQALHLRVMVGSVVELGIATAAGLQLAAALPELAYPSYLMGPLKYARQVTWPPLETVDSALPVPDGPGLGIAVDEEAVADMDLRGSVRA